MTEPKNESVALQLPINFQIKIIDGNVARYVGRDIQWTRFTKKEALKIAKFMRKAALTL